MKLWPKKYIEVEEPVEREIGEELFYNFWEDGRIQGIVAEYNIDTQKLQKRLITCKTMHNSKLIRLVVATGT